MTQKRKVSELKTNTLSLAIYGNHEDVSDLTESIRKHGLLSPLVIKPDGTILSGHRRFAAIRELGWDEVECSLFEPRNAVDEEIYVIEANRSRQKTVRQLRLEGERLKKLLAEQAQQKQLSCLRQGASAGSGSPAGLGRDRTQEEVSKQLGISRGLWNQINYINNHVEIGNPAAVEAAELLDAGKVSVNKAYRMVRSAVQALDGGDGSEEEKAEAAEQTAGEFNLACKESVARHMKEICAILEKVEKLSDEDFNMMPWRALDAAQKRLTRMLAELDERVKRKRVKLFENMKGAVADGTHQ